MSFGHLRIDLWIYAFFAIGIYALFALVGFVGWLRSLKAARLVEDLGTSTARAVAQGYVEIIGRQYPASGQALVAPLTGTACTWWHYKIEEYRRSLADGGRRTNCVVLEEATSAEPILFKDATGQLLVNPQGAEVQPSVTSCWYSEELAESRPMRVRSTRRGRYCYTEQCMWVGARMYVAGELHTVSGHRQADTQARATADLLGQWKRDQAQLVARFDRDQDGRIDIDEWELARATAADEVAARLRAHELPQSIDILRKPTDGQPFLISAKSQQELAHHQREGARLGLFLLLLGVGVLAYLFHLLWAVVHGG